MPLSAAEVIRLLELKPHPEGGYFRETFRDPRQVDGRAASTAIYFLLARGERSHWHRVDAAEVWHWHAGAPLDLEIADANGQIERVRLGSDLSAGERPQAIVPPHAWQGHSRSVTGRCAAARWRRVLNFPASNPHPRAGRPKRAPESRCDGPLRSLAMTVRRNTARRLPSASNRSSGRRRRRPETPHSARFPRARRGGRSGSAAGPISPAHPSTSP